jgi:outer membrane protein OmpA-like peptidoglycan-associated protein
MVVILFVLLASPASAQSDSYPKWDLFVGWQGISPGATVPTPFGDYNNPTPYHVPGMWPGLGSALTYNFDRHWGAEADFGHNWGSGNYEMTGSVGPRFMLRSEGANFFLHALVSFNRLDVAGLNPDNGVGAILGGGMDLTIKKWLAFRLFEGDYVWGRHNYSDFVAPQFPDLRRPSLEGARVRSGLVFSWGGVAPVAPSASCSVQPTEVMVGEPITATVSASNFNPKHTLSYSWSGNGVTGKDTSASIDTNNVSPGQYTVTAKVTDSKEKHNNEATCNASYTVKPLPPKNPPTMSCSSSPSSVQAGSDVTITCTCTSPDSVPVSVASWTSSAGSVNGSGNSATISTAGAAPGSITIGATCTDSRGLSAQASTQVTVQTPPPPPVDLKLQARLTLHSVYFATAQPSLKSPGGGLVASQQRTLSDLASDFTKYLQGKPDARLTLTGHADQRGSAEFNQALSERRVEAVKNFLVEHGVPAGAIDTQAEGFTHNLTTAEVKASIEASTDLTKEERARILRNMQVIKWASNRRVDIALKIEGQTTETSVRQYPFNAADSLTLIGGREAPKKAPAKAPAKKKPAAKKPQ